MVDSFVEQLGELTTRTMVVQSTVFEFADLPQAKKEEFLPLLSTVSPLVLTSPIF